MKGIVFAVLQKMIEEQQGLATWDRIVKDSHLPSGGSYTAPATYDDQEVFTIVGALSKITRVSVNKLIRKFGSYMLGALAIKYPKFFEVSNLKEFLISVDKVIHKEVRKLYPGAELPEFRYEDPGDGSLIMYYRSKRKLCVLAEGLIEGASRHFGEPVQVLHTECMHRGAEFCKLEVAIQKAKARKSACVR